MRDHDSQTVYAFVSKDGSDWTFVMKMSTLLTYAYYTGVAVSDSAQFSDVTVTETPQGHLTPFLVKQQDQITIHWNKPKQASWFNVYRTTDEEAGLTDPELKPGTAEPVDGSPWTLVLAGTRGTTYEDSNVRHGKVFYKILPIHADSSPQAFYGASVSADSIEDVMNHAVSLPASDYTKASYYLYRQELERIKAEMNKPDADEAALINDVYSARNLLEPYKASLYPFDGNADNVFGSSSATEAGTPEYPAGKIGQAIELNGTGGYVTLPATDKKAAADNITIAAWVYWKGGSQWQRIFDFGNNTNQYLFLSPRSGSNTLRFAIKNGGGEQFVETGQLAADQWVHVAVTLGDGTGKLYVNGELKAEKNNMTIKPSDFKPSNNYIGRSQFADPLFTGKIDDFRVYDTVLSAEEIQAVYNKTSTWFDDSLLALLLNQASKVDAECCTPESYEVLEVAAAHANTVASAEYSTQEDVDGASDDLLAALEGLQRKGVDVKADPAEPNGNNGWYTSPVTVTLKPTASAEYSLDGGDTWTAYREPVVLNEEGIYSFLYRSTADTDPAGSLEIKLDLTEPELHILGETSYAIDQTVSITCSARM